MNRIFCVLLRIISCPLGYRSYVKHPREFKVGGTTLRPGAYAPLKWRATIMLSLRDAMPAASRRHVGRQDAGATSDRLSSWQPIRRSAGLQTGLSAAGLQPAIRPGSLSVLPYSSAPRMDAALLLP